MRIPELKQLVKSCPEGTTVTGLMTSHTCYLCAHEGTVNELEEVERHGIEYPSYIWVCKDIEACKERQRFTCPFVSITAGGSKCDPITCRRDDCLTRKNYLEVSNGH